MAEKQPNTNEPVEVVVPMPRDLHLSEKQHLRDSNTASSSVTTANNDMPDLESRLQSSKGGSRTSSGEVKVQLTKVQLFLVFMGLALGIFLAALDQTIVATALYAIGSDFDALNDIAWVGTAYLLTMTAFQPTYGKFSDIFGRKITFLFAILMFELGSLLCGVAPNMTAMIISRAIAGIGGGGIMSLVMIIISDIVSLEERGKYQGMIGGVFGIASVVGPVLGGVFTDHVTWRWAFFINLPFGAVTVLSVVFLLHLPRPKGSLRDKLHRIDWWGTLAIVAATVALLLPLNWGGDQYEWDAPIIIVLLCVSVLIYAIFAWIEGFVATEPITPYRLFRDFKVLTPFGVNLFQGMAFFASVYYIPQFKIAVKGLSAMDAGLELTPLVLGVVFAAIISGQSISRIHKLRKQFLCVAGAALITVGAGLTSTVSDTTGRGAEMGYQIILGVGVGLIMQTTLLAGQAAVVYDDVATVTAMLNFFRSIGAVFGVAIVGTVYNNRLRNSIEDHAIPGVSYDLIKKSAAAVEHLPDAAREAVIESYVDAFQSAFIAIIPMGVLCFVCACLMGKNKTVERKTDEVDHVGGFE